MKLIAKIKLLILSLGILSGLNISADDAVRLIREDRMWEYVRYTGVAYEREIIQLQFDGTEVVDGVEYNLLKVRNHFKTNSGTHSYLDLMSENCVPIEHKPVRMRESGGRVYRIDDEAWCDSGPNEVLIMDFNLNKDEDANLHVGYSFLARPIKEILFPEELDIDYKREFGIRIFNLRPIQRI